MHALTTHPDAVFCPEYGAWVHPDDYTDGINDLENILREEARVTVASTSSKTMFFEGNSLYSYGYHYLLAFLQVTPAGEKHAYVNTTKYSQTTSHHCSTAISELVKAGWKIINTTQPEAARDGYFYEGEDRRDYTGIAAPGGKPAHL